MSDLTEIFTEELSIFWCSVNDSSSSQEDSAGKGVQNANQEKQSRKSPKKPRQPVNRFGEMSEEDVLKRTLPEHLGHNLDILFVSVK